MLARSLSGPSTPKASAASLLVRLLRLLPAGAKAAGWASHPLKGRAFARRTNLLIWRHMGGNQPGMCASVAYPLATQSRARGHERRNRRRECAAPRRSAARAGCIAGEGVLLSQCDRGVTGRQPVTSGAVMKFFTFNSPQPQGLDPPGVSRMPISEVTYARFRFPDARSSGFDN
jgi:hypothetical protein